MKVVILAGGVGSRISEESKVKPKPMVEIGGKPILWHIMKIYSFYGYHEFVICCGYKGNVIKDYFVNYNNRQADIKIELKGENIQICHEVSEPWKVSLIDTGRDTLTAGRILKIRNYVNDASFFLTYGDGVADIDIAGLLKFHQEHKGIITISTTRPEGRFGAVKIDSRQMVESFKEKARKDQAWVNMGFMVADPMIFDYLGDGSEMLETGPFEKVAQAGQMNAYKHMGFWSPMDNMNDKTYLENRWEKNDAPWKIWA